jgi:hypothetical protein
LAGKAIEATKDFSWCGIPRIQFAADSTLEQAGFELPVPLATGSARRWFRPSGGWDPSMTSSVGGVAAADSQEIGAAKKHGVVAE